MPENRNLQSMTENIINRIKANPWWVLLFALVAVKFTVFYSLVQVTANFPMVLLLSCLITFLILTGFRNRWAALAVYLVISIILFADITYFSFFNRYLSLQMLGAAEVIGDIGESIKQVMKPVNFVMFLDVILMGIFLGTGKISPKKKRRSVPKGKGLIPAGAILLVLILIVTNVTDSRLLTSLSNQEFYSFRLKDTASAVFGTSADAEVALSFQYEEQKNGPLFGIAEGRNVIIIQMESLQNFVIGREYNGQEITPYLNRLIDSNTIYFDNFYQQTGSGNTSDAEFATNNSILGSLTSYTYKLFGENTFRGLPVLLKEKGYSTAVYHAHESRGFWNREDFYPVEGFDTFYGGIINDTQNRQGGNFMMTEWMGWGLTDTEFYKQVIPYMKEEKAPFYSFIITLSNHHPYVMLDHYNYIDLLPEHRDTLAGNYLNSAAYTDYAIGQLLEDLKLEGLYDNSIIVLYGDHSGLVKEAETDRVMKDILGKDYDFEEVMRVPLIIHLPEQGLHVPESNTDFSQTVSTAGGQLDFLPTMAYLMGFPELDTIYLGQNLLTAKSGFVAQHTFMVKGSFFLDDIAYEMSRDGIFENGRAWNTKTGEPVSLEGLETYYHRSVSISETSQYLLDKDVLKQVYVEGKSMDEVLP